jgi:hypothetical protein
MLNARIVQETVIPEPSRTNRLRYQLTEGVVLSCPISGPAELAGNRLRTGHLLHRHGPRLPALGRPRVSRLCHEDGGHAGCRPVVVHRSNEPCGTRGVTRLVRAGDARSERSVVIDWPLPTSRALSIQMNRSVVVSCLERLASSVMAKRVAKFAEHLDSVDDASRPNMWLPVVGARRSGAVPKMTEHRTVHPCERPSKSRRQIAVCLPSRCLPPGSSVGRGFQTASASQVAEQ